jgi:signal transduction histidine kinase
MDGRQAAIKTLSTAPGDEVRILASVVHPAIIGLLDSGNHPVPYVVMELAKGQPLGEFVGKLTAEEAIAIVAILADALSAIHHVGIAHGDLKTDNVMVQRQPRLDVRLIDFGLAGEHSHGGTLAYAAPERLAGGPATPASDMYALGLMLWELVFGTLPWGEEDAERALLRRRGAPPVPPGGPVWLCQLLVDLLAATPAQRPSAHTVAETLAAQGAVLPPPSAELIRRRASAVHVATDVDLAIQQAVAERRSIVLVGPSGSGRTHRLRRLATELCAQGKPFVRLHGNGEPWSAIRDALADRRLPADRAPLPAGLDLNDRVHAATKALLRRSAEPITILVDDIETLDKPSRLTVELLARHRDATVVATSSKAVSDLPDVTIAPFEPSESAELLHRLLGPGGRHSEAVDAAHRYSSGNPARTIAWATSAVAQGVLTWRAGQWLVDTQRMHTLIVEADDSQLVDALSDNARSIGATLALLGRPTAIAALRTITKLASMDIAQALLSLADCGLIEVDGSGARASSGAASEALANSIPDATALHAAILRYMRGTKNPSAVALAWHALGAGDLTILAIVSEPAMGRLLHQDPAHAARLADAVANVLPRNSNRDVTRIRALTAAGRTDDALECAQSALAEHPNADLLIAAARVHLARESWSESLDLVERAKELTGGAPSLELLRVELSACLNSDDIARGIAAGKFLLGTTMPSQADEQNIWLEAMGVYAQCLQKDGQLDAAIALLEGVPEAARKAVRTRRLLDATLGLLLWHAGRLVEAGDVLLRASRSDGGLPIQDRARLANNAAIAAYSTGDLDNAIARWERAGLLFERLNNTAARIAVELNLCGGYREVGRWTRAKASGTWALEHARDRKLPVYVAMAAGNLGDVHFTLGENDTARTLFNVALTTAVDEGDESEEVEALRRLAALAVSTRQEDAEAVALRARDRAKILDNPVERWRSEALAALCVARAGKNDEATIRINVALDALRALESPRDLAEARLAAAEIDALAGRRHEATAALAHVASYAEDVGSVDIARRTQVVADRLKSTVRMTSDSGVFERALAIAAELSAEPDPYAAAQRLADACRDIANTDRAFVVFSRPHQTLAASAGASEHDQPAWPLIDRALERGRELMVADLGDRPDLRASTSAVLIELRAVMVLPMTLGGERYGALVVDSVTASEDELLRVAPALRALAHVMASALQRAEASAALKASAARGRAATHDMRNSVHTLLAIADVLGDEVRSTAGTDAVSALKTTGEGLVRIADDFLTDATARVEAVDVSAMVRELGALVRSDATRRGVSIDVDATGHTPILAHADGLRRALFNLVYNALQFSNTGGSVQLATHVDGDHVVCTVRDHGPGLPEGMDMSQLFNEGVTGGGHGSGHGIGLAQAAQSIANDGGVLTLVNHPDGGAIAAVRFNALNGSVS